MDRPLTLPIQTPFETIYLPDLVEFFRNEVISKNPLYIVPLGSFSSHLLDAVIQREREFLHYREEILHEHAFHFINRSRLRESRIALFYDTIISNDELQDDITRFHNKYGIRAVNAYVFAIPEGIDLTKGEGYEDETICKKSCDVNEFNWLYASMVHHVRSRILPPETDHVVFEIDLVESLPEVWDDIYEHLGTDIGPTTPYENHFTPNFIRTMAIHWPHFFKIPPELVQAGFEEEGVEKIRVYGDVRVNRLFLVPMVFGELYYNGNNLFNTGVDKDLAYLYNRFQYYSRQQQLSPQLLYDCLNLAAKIEMVCRFISVLSEHKLRAQVFRLNDVKVCQYYGQFLGSELSDYMKMRMMVATDSTVPEKSTSSFSTSSNGVNRTLPNNVAELLHSRYKGISVLNDGRDACEGSGLTFSEIKQELENQQIQSNKLSLSMTIDRLCSRTTILPYYFPENTGETTVVSRRYRFNELLVDGNSFPTNHDLNASNHISYILDVEFILATHAIAQYISHITKTSSEFQEKGVPCLDIEQAMIALKTNFSVLDRFAAFKLDSGEYGKMLVLVPDNEAFVEKDVSISKASDWPHSPYIRISDTPDRFVFKDSKRQFPYQDILQKLLDGLEVYFDFLRDIHFSLEPLQIIPYLATVSRSDYGAKDIFTLLNFAANQMCNEKIRNVPRTEILSQMVEARKYLGRAKEKVKLIKSGSAIVEKCQQWLEHRKLEANLSEVASELKENLCAMPDDNPILQLLESLIHLIETAIESSISTVETDAAESHLSGTPNTVILNRKLESIHVFLQSLYSLLSPKQEEYLADNFQSFWKGINYSIDRLKFAFDYQSVPERQAFNNEDRVYLAVNLSPFTQELEKAPAYASFDYALRVVSNCAFAFGCGKPEKKVTLITFPMPGALNCLYACAMMRAYFDFRYRSYRNHSYEPDRDLWRMCIGVDRNEVEELCFHEGLKTETYLTEGLLSELDSSCLKMFQLKRERRLFVSDWENVLRYFVNQINHLKDSIS